MGGRNRLSLLDGHHNSSQNDCHQYGGCFRETEFGMHRKPLSWKPKPDRIATQNSPMFLQRPAYNSSGLAGKKHSPVELALRGRLGLHLAEYRHHLLAALFAVKCRIQPQQTPIDADAEHSIRPPSPRSADLPNA